MPSTPNAIVAASFDDLEAIVVAADTGLDRFFFDDGICSRRLMTSIGVRHLAVADELLDGDHELAIASDTAVAFLR